MSELEVDMPKVVLLDAFGREGTLKFAELHK